MEKSKYTKSVFLKVNNYKQLHVSRLIIKVNAFFNAGIKAVLTERGQWLHDLDGNEWKVDCKNPFPGRASMCCARHFIQKRPDFAAQTTALEETVVGGGHIFELYPKYHCETNWIEMYWGGAKREARLHCDYTFKSLEAKIPDFLDKAGDIRKIRRYFQRCMNYIDAYSRCSDGREVVSDVYKFVTKSYLSHRKVTYEDL